MYFKDRFKHDVDKYGYVFLGMAVTNDPSRMIALCAFSDPGNAFACYEPLRRAKKCFGASVFYLPFEAAKKAAVSGNVRILNIYPCDDSTLFYCQNPKKDPTFTGFLKSWFERVENGQKGDK
jgi:hypothetical protein